MMDRNCNGDALELQRSLDTLTTNEQTNRADSIAEQADLDANDARSILLTGSAYTLREPLEIPRGVVLNTSAAHMASAGKP